MKNSELKEEYLDEETFWHITSKLNIESIRKSGLVPQDGMRDGVLKSKEDPEARVFFSYGLEAFLAQANNLAKIVHDRIDRKEKTMEGDNGENTNEVMQEFLNHKGGFINIMTFIDEEMFKNGINKNLSEQDLDKITYDISKSIWQNYVCLKADLEEGVDYSWDDYNFNNEGTKKVEMTKKNMHVFKNHVINPNKLEIITDSKGNPRSTWDVFKEMAKEYKDKYPDKSYLPVEEWRSGEDDKNSKNRKTTYTGEINHEKDYLSMFIEMEKQEKLQTKDIANNFAKDKNVALRKEEVKEVFEQLEKENEYTKEEPTLSEQEM